MRRRLVFCLLAACGPGSDDDSGPSTVDGPGSSTVGNDTAVTTGDAAGTTGATDPATTGVSETGGGKLGPWTRELDGCGGLNEVVILEDGDLLVVGFRTTEAMLDQPFVARYTPAGDEVWARVLSDPGPEGWLTAVERVGDDVIAVGHVGDIDHQRPLVVRLDPDGNVVWISDGEPAVGNLVGASWSAAQGRLWAVGQAIGPASADVLIATYGEDGTFLGTFPALKGGPTWAAAANAVAQVGDGAIVCGVTPTAEGAQPWIARYAGDGTQIWTVEGPDPGKDGYFSCNDIAISPDLAAVSAQGEQLGARVAQFDAGGLLQWEDMEPDASAEALSIDPNGVVIVAGWSVAEEHQAWLGRFSSAGELLVHAPLGVDHLLPRHVTLHPDGGTVLVGFRQQPAACRAAWLGCFD